MRESIHIDGPARVTWENGEIGKPAYIFVDEGGERHSLRLKVTTRTKRGEDGNYYQCVVIERIS